MAQQTGTQHNATAQFQTQLAFFTDPLHYAPPHGESLTALLQRLRQALAQLQTMPTEGDIAIVSHGGPLRTLLCSALHMPLNAQWQLCLDPGSLSILDLLSTEQQVTEKALQDVFPAGMLVKLNIQRPVYTRHTCRTSDS